MESLITINGREFPAPDNDLNFVISTQVNSGRNANAEVVGQIVGRNQHKIDNLKWSRLDAVTWSQMLQEFKNFYVVVKFPDMETNSWVTLKMYPGNRTATPVSIDPKTGLPDWYKNCKVNIIDCGIIGDK